MRGIGALSPITNRGKYLSYDKYESCLEYQEKYTVDVIEHLEKAAYISRRLRKERELSFYGDIDFIPTEEYTDADVVEAIEDAKFVVHLAQKVMS